MAGSRLDSSGRGATAVPPRSAGSGSSSSSARPPEVRVYRSVTVRPRAARSECMPLVAARPTMWCRCRGGEPRSQAAPSFEFSVRRQRVRVERLGLLKAKQKQKNAHTKDGDGDSTRWTREPKNNESMNKIIMVNCSTSDIARRLFTDERRYREQSVLNY